jgi:hypothetical protein
MSVRRPMGHEGGTDRQNPPISKGSSRHQAFGMGRTGAAHQRRIPDNSGKRRLVDRAGQKVVSGRSPGDPISRIVSRTEEVAWSAARALGQLAGRAGSGPRSAPRSASRPCEGYPCAHASRRPAGLLAIKYQKIRLLGLEISYRAGL